MDTEMRNRATRGAQKVISTCLGLTSGQELLIFCDENTLETALLLHTEARVQQVYSTIIFVPLKTQIQFKEEHKLPLPIEAAMRDATAILTCVSDEPQAMNFRVVIIRSSKNHHAKIGNSPGMNMEILSTAVDVDYSSMISQCKLLALAMVKGHTMEIVTHDSHGNSHSLVIKLGGWDRIPIPSTGIIGEGIWGNIPSGETYVAPLEGSANGEIVINGSVPGYVFGRRQEIILRFQDGELVEIEPPASSGAVALKDELQKAQANGDVNCYSLAEVGIGTNPGVKRLIGKALLDEKKAHTAHIALGTNKDFGGTIESTIHLDLVTQRPTILINGNSVMDNGVLKVKDAQWRESYLDVKLTSQLHQAFHHVARTGNRTNASSPRLLQRELIDGAGRVLHISVGDNTTAKMAATIYNRIPARGGISLEELSHEIKLSNEDILRVLAIMQYYELVKEYIEDDAS